MSMPCKRAQRVQAKAGCRDWSGHQAKPDFRFRFVPDGAKCHLRDICKRASRPFRAARHGLFCATCQGDSAATPGFRQPEGGAAVVNVVPVQADGLAETAAGVHQEHRQPHASLRPGFDRTEKPRFLVRFEEADLPRTFLLPMEFGSCCGCPPSCRLCAAICSAQPSCG